MNQKNMPSQRQVRYGEVIRSIISEALSREFFFSNNDDVKSITVSYVRMSKDLRKRSCCSDRLRSTPPSSI